MQIPRHPHKDLESKKSEVRCENLNSYLDIWDQGHISLEPCLGLLPRSWRVGAKGAQ